MNLSKEKISKIIFNIPAKLKYILEVISGRHKNLNRQIFLSPYGLGDTFILCLLSDEWEKNHNKKIHFYIKPSHEFILKGFPGKEYSIVKIETYPLYVLALINPWNKINSNHVFIAHMRFHLSFRRKFKEFNLGNRNLLNLYKEFLSVNNLCEKALSNFYNYLSNSEHTDLNLSNTIFLSSNANSLKNTNNSFWIELKNQILNHGFNILENDEKILLHTNESSIELNIKFEELVKIAYKCRYIITFRSGISDVLQNCNKKLFVIYPDQLSFKQYSLKALYENHLVNELILEDSKWYLSTGQFNYF